MTSIPVGSGLSFAIAGLPARTKSATAAHRLCIPTPIFQSQVRAPQGNPLSLPRFQLIIERAEPTCRIDGKPDFSDRLEQHGFWNAPHRVRSRLLSGGARSSGKVRASSMKRVLPGRVNPSWHSRNREAAWHRRCRAGEPVREDAGGAAPAEPARPRPNYTLIIHVHSPVPRCARPRPLPSPRRLLARREAAPSSTASIPAGIL